MNTGNYFLDALRPEIKQRLAFQLKPVRLSKHDFLYKHGEKIDSIYFPLTAVVSKFQAAEDGRAIEIALAGREGMVGLASAFDLRESMHTCQVCIGGSALKIRVEYILKIVENEPALKAELMRYINTQLKQMSRRVLCNRYHSVEQRLCTWMLLVVERSGKTSIRITHADAARALGVHRPTITEAALLLSERGILEQSTARIKLLNVEAVCELACDCLSEFSIDAAKSDIPVAHLRSRTAA